MEFPVHLRCSAVVAIVDCPDQGQFIRFLSLKQAALQSIWVFQESLFKAHGRNHMEDGGNRGGVSSSGRAAGCARANAVAGRARGQVCGRCAIPPWWLILPRRSAVPGDCFERLVQPRQWHLRWPHRGCCSGHRVPGAAHSRHQSGGSNAQPAGQRPGWLKSASTYPALISCTMVRPRTACL